MATLSILKVEYFLTLQFIIACLGKIQLFWNTMSLSSEIFNFTLHTTIVVIIVYTFVVLSKISCLLLCCLSDPLSLPYPLQYKVCRANTINCFLILLVSLIQLVFCQRQFITCPPSGTEIYDFSILIIILNIFGIIGNMWISVILADIASENLISFLPRSCSLEKFKVIYPSFENSTV